MEFLKEKYEVFVADNEDKEYLKSIIGSYHAIITRLTVIDRELIEAGINLEVIAKHGVGLDNIDTTAASERNIAIVTTGDANSLSVAEHTFFAIGALSKRIPYLDGSMRKGYWKARDESGAIDITGKKLGIAGIGRIGANVARIARLGFNMEVYAYDPYTNKKDIEAIGCTVCEDLDDMCRIVDFMTFHLPLTEETRNLLDQRRIELMKPTCFIVNFARGGIVNEGALYRALKENRLAGAALDVFSSEPPDHTSPLFELDSVILSPHCGAFTEDSRRRMSMRVAEGIDDVLGGRVPQ
jgi:D-3-phosphoglycerate dehydrogenase